MEENVRINITGDNRDALKKLDKVEQAVNRLNSAAQQVDIQVAGLTKTEREVNRLYEALERVENAALSRLPRSVQILIAYLKASAQAASELGARFAFANAQVNNLQRAKFIPAGLLSAGREVRAFTNEIELTIEAVRRLGNEMSALYAKALPRAGGSQGFTGFLQQQRPALPPGFGAGGPRLLPPAGGTGGPGGALALRSMPFGMNVAAGRSTSFDPNTLKGLRQGARYFRDLLEEVEIGTPRFRQLENVIADLNNRIKDAQLSGQKAGIGTPASKGSLAALRAQSESLTAAMEQAKIGSKEFRDLARSLEKTNREIDRIERKTKGRTPSGRRVAGNMISGAVLGGGFPLLTGGPSFSAGAGGIGGALGGLLGPGGAFAGGIAGSAIGAAIDSLVAKTIEFGKALKDPTANLDQLVATLGAINTPLGNLISQLKELGLSEVGASLALEAVNANLASLGIDPAKLEEDTTRIQNALERLQIVLISWGARFVPIVEGITNFLSGAARSATAGGGTAASAIQGSAGFSREALSAEKAVNTVLNDRLAIEQSILFSKQSAGKISTTEKTNLEDLIALQKSSAAITKLQIRAEAEKNAVKQTGLKFELRILKIKQQQLLADQQAALLERVNARVKQQVENELKLNDVRAAGFAQFVQNEKAEKSITDTYNLQQDALISLKYAQEQRFKEQRRALEENKNLSNAELETQLDLLQAEIYLAAARRTGAAQAIERERNAKNALDLRHQAALDLIQTEKQLELQRAQLSSPEALLQNAGEGFGFFKDTITLAKQQAFEFNTAIQSMDRQLGDLEGQMQFATPAQQEELQRNIELLEKSKSAYMELQPAINQAALEQQAFADAFKLVEPAVSSLLNGFTAVIEGTKSVEEAFAEFLKTIADTLMQSATQMIATYIAIGIAKAFAGLGSNTPDVTQSPNLPSADLFSGGLTPIPFAEGGFVDRPTNALIGEGGEPEYVIPESKMRESMGRYSRGSRGGAVIPQDGGESGSPGGGGTAVATPIDVRYTVDRINNVDYVTADQFQRGMQSAATQGAKQGEQNTLKRLQMSGSTRKRLGL